MRLNLLGDREFLKKLSGLTWPLVFQSLMLALVAAADAFMLGRVEQNAMAAVSLATQIQFVQNMVLFSAASAASILGAQYWGKKDEEALNYIFGLIINKYYAIGGYKIHLIFFKIINDKIRRIDYNSYEIFHFV